jgi:PTH1 family peptidyl-tRNA hydrolase
MWLPFFKKKAPSLPLGWWLIVPLGNPGDEYASTRHNLGRLALQRWADANRAAPAILRALCFGTVFSLGEPFMALVPSTFMNLSGKALAEAVRAGFPVDRMLILHDEKDLPLGMGRLSVGGGAAGHGGVQSIFDELGTQDVFRLRLGIGPCQRPLRDWVLAEWSDREWEAIEGMDAPFAALMSKLGGASGLEGLRALANAPEFWKNSCNQSLS